MVHRSTPTTLLLAATALLMGACGGGSNVSNASPRLGEIPLQSVTGGSALSLDLGTYVSDRENATLTYAVTSGGGSFAGSTYTNTFDTLGTYEVAFTVSDGAKTTTGTFQVKVSSANLVVVREDQSGLLLLDSATNAFVRVAGAAPTPDLQVGNSDGRFVYETAGATTKAYLFDVFTRTNTQLGANEGDATYEAKTSDNKILYTTGTTNDRRLWLFNPLSGTSREIASGLLSTRTVLVNSSNIVFYETGVNGQADVHGYDVAQDETFVVGDAATDEQLQAVLPNGGVVFSRTSGSGAHDLFYYKVSTGLVEIGADVTALDTRDKVYAACGTNSHVVFMAQSGTTSDVCAWNPSNGDTTEISTLTGASGDWDDFVAIGAGNEVVFSRTDLVSSPTETDAFFYDLDSGTTATVRNASDISNVVGVSSDGTTAWAFVRPSGTTSSLLAVSLVASPSTQTWAAGGAVSTTLGVLANGDIVGQRSDGGALALFDVSAGTWGTPITGTGLQFAGDGIDTGDFVYSLTASSQTDLSMWDASGTTSIVVSNTTGDDVFQAKTANGTVLFTRVTTGNTNADLFVWNGTAETQLTTVDGAGLRHDHTVLGKFAGSR